MSYIYNNAKNIRTKMTDVIRTPVCVQSASPAALAIVKCEEEVTGQWREGKTLVGVITDINSTSQIEHIVNRGHNVKKLKETLQHL
mgnify:CR=1 FL=1|tara:strand:- start:1097 stop:1354 length:258 start_codon:yes stop_codon:yes gene_type:complete